MPLVGTKLNRIFTSSGITMVYGRPFLVVLFDIGGLWLVGEFYSTKNWWVHLWGLGFKPKGVIKLGEGILISLI